MIHTLDYRIHQVAGYINWLYFFHAWQFPSRYGSIAQVHGCTACRQNWLQQFPAEERVRAQEAMRLYDDACRMLREQEDRGITTHFRFTLLEANSRGDDIVVEGGVVLPFLRQQVAQEGAPCLCLSDFVRPLSRGIPDRIGVFVSTVDEGMECQYPEDAYRHMLCQTLADRLAEATAECGHQEVRQHIWAYAPDEHLTVEELFAERYVGKRPAVGYPNMPDQSLNFILSRLLDFPSLPVRLTEHGAMLPHASTSGLMLAHPATCHFSVGAVGADQFRDYAARRGVSEQWLRPFLLSSLAAE